MHCAAPSTSPRASEYSLNGGKIARRNLLFDRRRVRREVADVEEDEKCVSDLATLPIQRYPDEIQSREG
jgi:hypothetical protein